MITEQDLYSIGTIRRTKYKDLPEFVFVLRDGLFVPFRSEHISELIGEQGYVLKGEMEIDEDEMAWTDFEGWTLQDGHTTLGKMVRVDDSTMNVFAELEDGRMVPLHEDFIVEIDEDARVLQVQLPFEL